MLKNNARVIISDYVKRYPRQLPGLKLQAAAVKKKTRVMSNKNWKILCMKNNATVTNSGKLQKIKVV